MYQSVKPTDAISLLQLVVTSPLIHALGGLSQAPTRMTYQLSYPSPFSLLAYLPNCSASSNDSGNLMLAVSGSLNDNIPPTTPRQPNSKAGRGSHT